MRFRAASDQSLLVYLGDEISLDAHRRVLHLLRALELQKDNLGWLRNLQPAYCSLLVTFDPLHAEHGEVETAVRACLATSDLMTRREISRKLVLIPVCYGGEFGPDLDELAAARGLSVDQVIRFHSERRYHAYFLGFAPGWAYLGDVAEEIAMPRLDSPRKSVPAGSVAIAGRQTGVYPFASPGGWRLIGRTPLRMFRTDREPMNSITIGDTVVFQPISREEFARLEREP